MEKTPPETPLTALDPEEKVASVFDTMAGVYDQVDNLWYAWLFSRLHWSILEFLSKTTVQGLSRCLDVGCGSGFQSFLLAACGLEIIGVDISPESIAAAREKIPQRPGAKCFSSPFEFAAYYDAVNEAKIAGIRKNRDIGGTRFEVASATGLPFGEAEFDVVACCGSALSFIGPYREALAEMVRVLRPGGYLFLEVENKLNADLAWAVLDSAAGGFLGYHQNFLQSVSNAISFPLSHVTKTVLFPSSKGDLEMKVRQFSSLRLQWELSGLGLTLRHLEGFNSLTNLLPSALLHHARPSEALQTLFAGLAKAEELAGGCPF